MLVLTGVYGSIFFHVLDNIFILKDYKEAELLVVTTNNKFVILSNKPYSNVPAERLGLEEEQWRNFSVIIRREHECTHYFTKRFLGSSRNNLHDELVADFTGIMCAVGEFNAFWLLRTNGFALICRTQCK